MNSLHPFLFPPPRLKTRDFFLVELRSKEFINGFSLLFYLKRDYKYRKQLFKTICKVGVIEGLQNMPKIGTLMLLLYHLFS